LLRRKRIKRVTETISQQAQLLADLLGGGMATWQLASNTVSGRGNAQSNQYSVLWTTVHIQARVLCIDLSHPEASVAYSASR
jgi:hypothetical protein